MLGFQQKKNRKTIDMRESLTVEMEQTRQHLPKFLCE